MLGNLCFCNIAQVGLSLFACLLLQAGVITDLVLLWTVGIRPVLVHGGGPEINSWLTKLGIQPEFKNGLRVTDGTRRTGSGDRLLGAVSQMQEPSSCSSSLMQACPSF